MANLSFCPFYFQDVIWCCEFSDGTLLREWNDEGKETPFREIPKEKLVKFHLIGQGFDYWFDCKTGEFVVEGRRFVFPLAGLELKFGEGLIHFKDASTDLSANPRGRYDGFHIYGYNMGWKVTDGNVKCQVIFSLPSRQFDVEMTFLDFQKTVRWKLKV